MHSFQPSRGRILFEVFCALAVVASMVGAWQQTQASALLTAAAAAGLYAMVRLFDLIRHEPVQAEEPQRIEFEPEAEVAVPVHEDVVVPFAPVEPQPVTETAVEQAEIAEPAAPRTGAGRRKGGSRKSVGRRASASKAKAVEVAPVVVAEPELQAEPASPVHFDEPEAAETPVAEEADLETPEFHVEPAHQVPHAPLFEPEPFVRMQRQAFGRRGRI